MIFYKYIPYRDGFFTDLYFRATPIHKLNDPFEGAFSKESLKKYFERYAENMGLGNVSKRDLNDYENDINLSLNNYGIVSLTEEPDNILMWSHYAHEHTGLVIGLVVEKYNTPFNDNFKNDDITQITPVKVDYRTSFSHSKYLPLNTGLGLDNSDLIISILTTKSNDWIYEKEHRIILPLDKADRILVSKCDIAQLRADLKVYVVENEGLHYKKQEKGEYFQFDMINPLDDKDTQNISYILNSTRSAMSFFKISKHSILEVILGCRMHHSIKANILAKLSEKLYNGFIRQAEVSKSHFTLNITDII